MLSQSIRVLVVDGRMERDDRIDEILAAAGFPIRVVNDSVSAAGALEIWWPSVAIVDLRSPSSAAVRFCADLARSGGAADLPVVLVGEGPNVLKPRPVIPAGLVTAPVDPDQLVAAVSRATRGTSDVKHAVLTSRGGSSRGSADSKSPIGNGRVAAIASGVVVDGDRDRLPIVTPSRARVGTRTPVTVLRGLRRVPSR